MSSFGKVNVQLRYRLGSHSKQHGHGIVCVLAGCKSNGRPVKMGKSPCGEILSWKMQNI
ncbi:hypothetical protein LY78DRAFT_658424 [Colletotrichum sublineola]|nr:hypothetical protein LY78DRAFT_658424 [Colletotrichum sublineola]